MSTRSRGVEGKTLYTVHWVVSSKELFGTKGKHENIQYLEERLLVKLLLAASSKKLWLRLAYTEVRQATSR